MWSDCVSVKDSIFAWLVEHVADVINRYHVGSDGKTVFRRLRGRPYGGEYFEFGSPINHRVTGRAPGGIMQERWMPGIWLGRMWSSDEQVVTTPDGEVVRARGVCEQAEGTKIRA